MTKQDTGLAVRKSISVEASQERAFSVFTEGMGTWWPLDTHHIGAADAAAAVLEPRVGGRLFERGVDGSECDWGRVLVWEPPDRFVYVWQINADWQHDTSIESEVEVRFIAEGPTRTRVELEHRKLETFGDKAENMHEAFDSSGGWGALLESFASAAAA